MPDPPPALPPRPPRAHKGSFGEVIVVGGSPGMLGAPCFVAAGALRAGCGAVRLVAPPELLTACLGLVPSAIGLARGADAAEAIAARGPRAIVAAGPGLGLGAAEADLVHRLLDLDRPLLLDGDALALLAAMPVALPRRSAPLVLTPHPGEYARLATRWGLQPEAAAGSDAEREAAAVELARATGAVVVLKGHATVVEDGSGPWTCSAGDATLAIPGSGDVLAGVIAGLWAQGMPATAAARLGVHLHAIAGDLWRHTRPCGMMAMDLAGLIPAAARLVQVARP